MRVLILEGDKERQRIFRKNLNGAEVTIVDNVREAIGNLLDKKWDYVFLDHDLGKLPHYSPGENTGYTVACWLKENWRQRPKNIIIHAMNPVGAAEMLKVLPQAKHIPGIWLSVKVEDKE